MGYTSKRREENKMLQYEFQANIQYFIKLFTNFHCSEINVMMLLYIQAKVNTKIAPISTAYWNMQSLNLFQNALIKLCTQKVQFFSKKNNQRTQKPN